jgi:ribosomal protein S18 acetylase RimI-like enzyme
MVHLKPMTESEFQSYRKGAVEEYARQRVREGDWQPADALHKAEQEFLRMLPQGVNSKNQYLLSIQADQTDLNLGMLWFAVRGAAPHLAAFIYDFMISEQFRQRGYGMQALSALDEKAKELGIATIALHVFGHNQAAIALYQKAGYEITNLQMAKKLSS